MNNTHVTYVITANSELLHIIGRVKHYTLHILK